MSIYCRINGIVENMLQHIETEGTSYIRGGCNGPYYDIETDVRNLAHWCATFSKYYEVRRDERYKNAAILLADAILDSDSYNGNGVYICRQPDKKDEINGVIGPAWIMEGLLYAYSITDDLRYFDRALDLFFAQPFHEKLGIWNRRNTKGEKLSVDVTFNHQLWFAAAGAMLCYFGEHLGSSERAGERGARLASSLAEIDRFVACLPKNCTVRGCGRVGHFTANDQNGFISAVLRRYRERRSDLAELMKKPSMAYKEAGYDLFNLYGFAVLKDYYRKDIPFFQTKRFAKCLTYIKTEAFEKDMRLTDYGLDGTRVSTKLKTDKNVFAYPYNSPAFEMGRVLDRFDAWDEAGERNYQCFLAQMDQYPIGEDGFFGGETDDPITLTARVYEMVTGDLRYFDAVKSENKG